MAVVLEDLPPLLWHAELGRSLPDAWTGNHQRGVQLHDLADAVRTWRQRYGQRVWLRQLVGPADDGGVTREMAQGPPCPPPLASSRRDPAGGPGSCLTGRLRRGTSAETAYCAELVATTYAAMGLLDGRRPRNAYDRGASGPATTCGCYGVRRSVRRSRSPSRRLSPRGAPGRSSAPSHRGRSACARARAARRRGVARRGCGPRR